MNRFYIVIRFIMKVKIHYSWLYEDEIEFECETIEEAKAIANTECLKRNWSTADCWSEVD